MKKLKRYNDIFKGSRVLVLLLLYLTLASFVELAMLVSMRKKPQPRAEKVLSKAEQPSKNHSKK